MNDKTKKILIISVIFIIIIGLVVFLVVKSKGKQVAPVVITEEIEKKPEIKNELESLIDASRLIGGLPVSDEKIGVTFEGGLENELIEYISFLDFYNKEKIDFVPNILNYQLPLNVKTDVANYYDISRKVDLDRQIDNLNNNGFAVIENPFSVNNFYDIYDELNKKQISPLITSDFLIYYYQQSLKQTFKDIEENIFHANLWEINRFLYEKARIRYENNLSAKGDVNDRVLEAQRLATAYFATSLELLKPIESQINRSNDLSNKSLFTTFEAENYSFSLPSYLKVDVEKEVSLIRQAQVEAKSPVLLYKRDYKNFIIPSEYKSHAKLNNFYLATKWLSSNFPLYFKEKDCPQCQLDFDDWRISMITSSLIAQDIFDSYELKNKWARIYKTLAFFRGLRGDLTYVHYRDALVELFGQNYKIDEIFSDNNPDSINNLYRFREKVLKYEFLDIEGGFNRDKIEDRDKLGVKMLTDFYWPNNYILNQLSYPYVSKYQNGNPRNNNITFCKIGSSNNNVRCNGFSLDIIALINERNLVSNEYYFENSRYDNYFQELSFLKSQISRFSNIWHYNNFWKTLNVMKEYLQNNKNSMPVYSQNNDWRTKELYTAVGSWINLQIPPDKLRVYQKYQGQPTSLAEENFVSYGYIEPNIDLVNEQISNINMILEMFRLLKITDELRLVLVNLEDLKNNLVETRKIIIKELTSQALSQDDLAFIASLGLEFKLDQASSKSFSVESPNSRLVNYDISTPKLMVLATKVGEKISFSIGPVFNYRESR